MSTRVRGRLPIVALLLLTLAWGAVLESTGPNQNAHLALVKAISHGTPRIDAYHRWSRDVSYVDGRYYTAKAPGLALATVPWYLALDATGLVVAGPPPSVPWPTAETHMARSAVWEVGLFGALLPLFCLMLLVRSTTERFVPGFGTLAAATLGGASLVAVLATLFFDHVLSALLGFGAFAILVRERRRPADLKLLFAAGLVAGYAVVVELPLALVALVLGGYALLRTPRRRRAAAYAAGLAVGVVPLLAFNTWALGSPTALAYAHAVIEPGRSGHEILGANSSGFFGVGVPSLRAGVELLFSAKGLLVLTPVWALAVFGIVVLWRAGSRAEAAVIGAVGALFLLYDAAYYLPFAGFNSGPRLLVPMLPFLAVALAAAWRVLPGPASALAVASAAVTGLLIVSDPMLVVEDVGTRFHRLERGGGTSGPLPLTVLHWLWNDSRTAHLLLVLAVAALGLALAVAATPLPRLRARDLLLAVAALVAWRIVYVAAPLLLRDGGTLGLVTVILLAAAVTLAVLVLARGRLLAALPAMALLPLLRPTVPAHAGATLGAVMMALAGIAIVLAARRPSPA
jgi:hypothetical protein